MELAKHRSGAPLSEAEHKQRRDAARARWAVLAAGGGAGALIGSTALRARTLLNEPRRVSNLQDQADAALVAGHTARETAIGQAIRQRLRTRITPPPNAAPGIPEPVVGNVENAHVYDYQIARLRRQMQRTSDDRTLAELRGQIGDLNTLKRKRLTVITRAPTIRAHPRTRLIEQVNLLDHQLDALADHPQMDMRQVQRLMQLREAAQKKLNAMPDIPVRAAPVRQVRGGETSAQLEQRIAGEKSALRRAHSHLLARLSARTLHLRTLTREHVLSEAERSLRRRLIASSGRGAAIGAAIGLTAAGVSLLAHHLVVAGRGRNKTLSKADKAKPETSIGQGMAETYREWIDRLLGRHPDTLNIGDKVAANLGAGITAAFAAGATQPPLPGPEDNQYRIDVDFDQLNPAVRRHMADYALDRIVEISAQQQEAIRDVLMQQSVLQGIGPRDVARSIREHIGLTPYQMGIVQGYRTELEALDPAALERQLRDARYDRTVRKAIETGTPLSADQIDAMVDAYHRRMLALRAETIARTESIRATSYGAVARAQDVLDQHPELDVIKRWIATDDERTRPTHEDLDGKEVTGIQTPFRTSAGNLIKWPIDQDAAADECINCRCSIGFRFVPKSDQSPS